MFIRKRIVNGVRYYSLVEASRKDGAIVQRQVKNLGRYEKAVEAVKRLRIDDEQRRQWLLDLVKHEGRFIREDAPTLPQQHFQCILIDPPWRHEKHAKDSKSRGQTQYQTMGLEDIRKLPLADLADPDGCYLWLWITAPCLPWMDECLDAWGFTYKATYIWVKTCKSAPTAIKMGLGDWGRNCFEMLVLATRGKAKSLGQKGLKTANGQPNVIMTPDTGEHSQKPTVFYELIERLCPEMTRLEMFARSTRPGWESWGNEVGSLDQPVA